MSRLETISNNNRRYRLRDLVVFFWFAAIAGIVATLAVTTIHSEWIARFH